MKSSSITSGQITSAPTFGDWKHAASKAALTDVAYRKTIDTQTITEFRNTSFWSRFRIWRMGASEVDKEANVKLFKEFKHAVGYHLSESLEPEYQNHLGGWFDKNKTSIERNGLTAKFVLTTARQVEAIKKKSNGPLVENSREKIFILPPLQDGDYKRQSYFSIAYLRTVWRSIVNRFASKPVSPRSSDSSVSSDCDS